MNGNTLISLPHMDLKGTKSKRAQNMLEVLKNDESNEIEF